MNVPSMQESKQTFYFEGVRTEEILGVSNPHTLLLSKCKASEQIQVYSFFNLSQVDARICYET